MLSLNPQLEQHLTDHGEEVLETAEKQFSQADAPVCTTSRQKVATEEQGNETAVTTVYSTPVQGVTNKASIGALSLIFGYSLGVLSSRDQNVDITSSYLHRGLVVSALLLYGIGLIVGFGLKHFYSLKNQFVRKDVNATLEMNHVQNMDRHCHECRKKVSTVLGSVGAPPLAKMHVPAMSSVGTVIDWNDLKAQFDKLVEFTRAHADLFVAFDRAVEIMRIGTGMRLGLGPSSPCVERVEIAALGREHRMKQHHHQQQRVEFQDKNRSVSKGAVSFQSKRELVWRTMREQCSSFDSILGAFHGDVRSGSTLYDPNTITLSSLRVSRRNLAELLSHVLSLLTTTSVLRKWTTCTSPNLALTLQRSTWMALEARQHVESAFSHAIAEKDVCPAAALPSSNESRPWRKYVDQIHTQVDATYVALWALNNNISAGDSVTTQRDGVEEWFSRIGVLLADAVDVHQKKQAGVVTTEPGADVDSDTHTLDTGMSKDVHRPTHFEHSGESSDSSVHQPSQHAQLKNKTAVFTGTGSLSQAISSSESYYTCTKAESECNERNQANLMEELSTRLGMMDLVEEIDMTSKINDDEDDNTIYSTRLKNDVKVKELSKSATFLEASGALLAELKLPMTKNLSDNCRSSFHSAVLRNSEHDPKELL